MFRGSNGYYANNVDGYCYFSCTEDCYVYGNVMSLIDKNNFATATTLTAVSDRYAFKWLFKNNTRIDISASKDLVLPATDLDMYCYAHMFENCTSLTISPVLLATKLEGHCYQYMFSGCSNLNRVTCCATDLNADECIGHWLDGIPSTGGTFYKASYMSENYWKTHGVPPSWTVTDYSGK